MRAILRSTLVAGLTGVLIVSAAWAGVSFSPLGSPTDPAAGVVSEVEGALADSPVGVGPQAPAAARASLRSGQLLVGAAKSSMAPRPKDMAKRFPGARWETRMDQCQTLEPAWFEDLPTAAVNALDGIANPGSTWPENPDCIYQGGFGLGPMNPVKAFDKTLGLWVRSLAMSDGKQTIVLTVIDGEGWLWDYRSKCTDCGAKQINAALANDPALKARGVTGASHILHATHSHASPDFIGGWGFVPNWYMAQITDTIKATAKRAVMTMQAATLETGEVEARAYNSERRDTYRSAEESSISWLRAVTAQGKKRTIATLGSYAAHPTSVGNNNGVAHPDWPGLFEKRVEQRFGGMGLHFMSGLGNMSNSGGPVIGTKLGDLIPSIGRGRKVRDTRVKVAHTTTNGAITNVPLDLLGTAGLFDRKFGVLPALVNTGESETAPCISASPQSVELPVSAARIGTDITFTAAPGEVFANYTNTLKEKSPGRITFPLAQANDALGYMPQSFEINPVGQQGLGFAAGGYLFVNYEDSYAVDRCTGDLVLEETIKLLETVKK
jgi:hypothetical protein